MWTHDALSHAGINLTASHDSRENSTVIFTLVISFLLILTLTIVISILTCCRMKLRNRTPDDTKAIKICAPNTKSKKQTDTIKTNVLVADTIKTNVLVAPNQAYAIHNVSRCVNISTYANEAYAVCNGISNDEPVYEVVK